ncbi:MAG: protein kinase [Planctomycetes bacterium]|nr:protein kinase [Planctomycetota bacterium]
MIGRQIGDYNILSKLGEGGMGLVYKAEHATLGQLVAVKSLHPSLLGNQAAKDRFVREAQALARLNHPNIIGLLNFISDTDGCYIIMEYAEGEDLEHKLERMGLIPPPQCLPWFMEACRGLNYAHEQGIIHRDIKPSNIIVHPAGTTKLLDFGTAKLVDAQRLTQQGMTLGTVIYMSKEQLLGKPLTAASDVYSLGVTLYECVTSHLPFYDEEERKLVVKIAKEDPIPPRQHYPGISTQLEAIILKAMAKDPKQRYASATEFEHALAGLPEAGGSAAAITAPSPPIPAVASVPAAPTPAGAVPVAAAPGQPLNVSELLFSPLFLAGFAADIVALGGGLPLIVLSKPETGLKTVGFVVFLLASMIGVLLMGLAFVKAKGKGGGAAPTAAPPVPAAGHQAPAPAPLPLPAPAPLPVPPMPMPAPAPATFDPGGTLNINSANAANQAYAVPSPQALPQGSSAMLQVIDGNDKGTQVSVPSQGAVSIGRAPTCTIPLNDPGVSGHHASITFEGPQLMVIDAGSRNGVFLNNQKVSRHPLKSGDLVVIGSTRILVNMG